MKIFPILTNCVKNSNLNRKEKINNSGQLYWNNNRDTFSKSNFNVSFGSNTCCKDFDSKVFLQSSKSENAQKKYYFSNKTNNGTEYYEKILPNKEAIEKLKALDGLTVPQQKEFIKEFCSMTGFPDFEAITQNIEKEIYSSIYGLAKQDNFDVAFIGYDSNCSVGRKLSIPGSDCDGLFMIINPRAHKESWYPGKIRWDFKDHVNQRILSTPANHLPEVLSTDFIEQGLQIAQDAFNKCDFSQDNLERFEKLLNDNTNDFVKSAEFNIRMAQKVPDGISNRDLYYKTAMLAEIIRDGIVCENNFDEELYNKILNSPLYKYSNLMKQRGLKHSLKSKYIARKTLRDDFYQMHGEQQFKLIKDILHYSFGKVQDNENKKYFYNLKSDNNDEMGNIEKMYDLIMNIPYNGK